MINSYNYKFDKSIDITEDKRDKDNTMNVNHNIILIKLIIDTDNKITIFNRYNDKRIIIIILQSFEIKKL